MSVENSVEHFAARALAINQPGLFHVVGEAAAGRHPSPSSTPRAYGIYKTGLGSYSVRVYSGAQFRQIAPLSRLASDPFTQGVTRSTGGASMEKALDDIQEEEALGWPVIRHEPKDVRELGEAYKSLVDGSDVETHTITALALRTPAAPTQYDGITEDGKPVYIRYRGGSLRIDIGGLRGSDGTTVHSETRGSGFDGVLPPEELQEVLASTSTIDAGLDFSAVEEPSFNADDEATERAAEAADRFNGRPEKAAHALIDAAATFSDVAERTEGRVKEAEDDSGEEAASSDELWSELWWLTRGLSVSRVGRHLNKLYTEHNDRDAVVSSFYDSLMRVYERLADIEAMASEADIKWNRTELYDAVAAVRTAADDLHTLLL